MGTRLGTLDSLIILVGRILFPTVADEERCGLLRRFTVVIDQDVGVRLQEEADVGVPDSVADHLRADTGFERTPSKPKPEAA